MQLLRCVGVVVNVYADLLAFLEAKEWSGEVTIVGRGRNDALGGDLEGGRSIVEREVRGIVSVLWIGHFTRQGDNRRLGKSVFGAEHAGSRPETDGFQELPSRLGTDAHRILRGIVSWLCRAESEKTASRRGMHSGLSASL